MSGDPMREYFRELERQRRREQIRAAIGCVLIVLGTLVCAVFAWAMLVWLYTV